MKNWYNSWTVWSGITKLVGGLLVTISAFLAGDVNAQMLLTGIVGMGYGIHDIIIRFQTNTPLKPIKK